MAEKQLA